MPDLRKINASLACGILLALMLMGHSAPLLQAQFSVSLDSARIYVNQRKALEAGRLTGPTFYAMLNDPDHPRFGEAILLKARAHTLLREPDSLSAQLSVLQKVFSKSPALRKSGHSYLLAVKGLLLYRQRKFPESFAQFDSLMQDGVALLKKMHPNDFAYLANIHGIAAEEAGKAQTALNAYENGLRALENPDAFSRLLKSVIHHNLGSLYRTLGDFDQALFHLRKDLELTEALLGPDGKDAADTRFNLGNVYLDAGDYRLALEYFDRTEAAYRTHNVLEGQAGGLLYNSKGIALQALGRLDDAEKVFMHALQIRRTTYGTEDLQVTYVLNNLAGLYQQQQKPEKALEYAQKVVRFREKTLQPNDIRMFSSRQAYARALLELNRLDDASAQIRLIKEIADSGYQGNPRFFAESRSLEAGLFTRKGNIPEALDCYRKITRSLRSYNGNEPAWLLPGHALEAYTHYFELLSGTRNPEMLQAESDTLFQLFFDRYHTFGRNDSRLEFTASFQRSAAKVVQNAYQLYNQKPGMETAARVHRFVSASRSVTLKRLVRENEFRNQDRTEAGNREAKLFRRMNELEAALIAGTGAPDSVKKELVSLRTAWLKERDAVRKESQPEGFIEIKPLHEIQQRLPENHCVLEFFSSPEETILLKISPENVEVVKIEISENLKNSIDKFRNAIIKNDETVITTQGRFIYKILFNKINIGSNTSVHVIPDDLWSALPLDLLVDDSGSFSGNKIIFSEGMPNPELTETYKTYSGFAPVFFAPGQFSTPDVTQRGAVLAPLPHSAGEVVFAAALFNKQRSYFDWITGRETGIAYLKEQATESAFKRHAVGNDGVLHVATHTIIDPDVPARSRLVLQPDQAADGWVLQQEMLGLIKPAGLVFLSSCSSVEGGHIPGEGIWGLTAAFKLAGAKRIVATRWPVADKPAAAFSNLFFTALVSGKSPAESLAFAKRQAMMQPEVFRFRDWSAYVLLE